MASLNPDSVKLMTAVLNDRNSFPEAHRSLPAIATKLAVDEVKARPTDVALFRTFRSVLDDRDFVLLLDALAKPTLAKVVKSLDSANPAIRGAEAGWLRKHLVALLNGEPAYVKPSRATRSTAASRKTSSAAPPKAATMKRETNPTKAKNSKAKWDGKNRDEET